MRGRLEGRFPLPLECSIRLHRRLDVVTDAHPLTALARARFDAASRRYAGILLDLLYDHCLALDWPRGEPLTVFAQRAAEAVADDGAWQLAADKPAPSAARFGQLLLSYREEVGIDIAIARVAERLSQPQRLLDAAQGWRAQLPALREELPALLGDLETVALDFVAA